MNKNALNNVLRKFGFEVHGTGYMQSVQKTGFKEDAFEKQAGILPNAAVIFDAGANFGDTVLKYHSLYPEAAIYAFEPFPATFAGLIEKTKSLKLVHGFQVALSDHPGTDVFYVNKNVDTNSLLQSQNIGLSSDAQVQNEGRIDVNLVTIDAFCAEHRIGSIDILKLDIQGGELAALKGAERLLREKKIKLIYSETYFRPQYVNQPLFYDIANYLRQFGYHLQDIYNPIYGKGSIAWCDVIFLP